MAPPKMVLMPIIAFISVLLPEPFGPSTALNLPGAKAQAEVLQDFQLAVTGGEVLD